MRKELPAEIMRGRDQFHADKPESIEGRYLIRSPSGSLLCCLVSTGEFWETCLMPGGRMFQGEPWEHVSVSVPGKHRCPTWDEMQWVKTVFWEPEETVIQFHPPQSQYVNVHKYVLHMWRPWRTKIPLPPKECV